MVSDVAPPHNLVTYLRCSHQSVADIVCENLKFTAPDASVSIATAVYTRALLDTRTHTSYMVSSACNPCHATNNVKRHHNAV